MNTSNAKTCRCNNCPGQTCKCGCQDAQPAKSCGCGSQCRCGSNCACAKA